MRITWLELIKEAFGTIGTELSLNDLYKRVYDLIDTDYPEKRILNVEATIRGTLERNSEDSDAFVGDHCFEMSRGKGKGYWRRVK